MEPIERFFERGLKLSHLRLVALFASLGQIRLVADRLHVTQPAISKQLAELEEGLGAAVLTRVGNRLQFTALGEALLKRAREVLLQLEQARHEVDALSTGISGAISIGAVATVLPVIAPELTLQLKKRAPNVSVSFLEDTSDKLFPRLASSELDLVFSRSEAPTLHCQVVGDRILEDPIVVVCGREHPLASRRPLVPSDLKGIPWILPPRDAPIAVALRKWLGDHDLTLPPGCVQSIYLVVNEALLKSYPFLGMMPLSVAKGEQHREDIRVLNLPGASFLPGVWAFHNHATVNPVVGAALDCVGVIRERFAEQGSRKGLVAS
jgi:DNA-binding transcriptional LysR family regulator